MSVTISIRIRKELKEELERLGVDIAEEIRRHLEEVVVKHRIKKLVEEWDRLLENVKPSEKGFASRSVREDREGH